MLPEIREVERYLKAEPTPWDEKIPKAFFRGATTGGRNLTQPNSVWAHEGRFEHNGEHKWMLKDFDKNRWRHPRANLALKSEEFPHHIDAGFSALGHNIHEYLELLYPETTMHRPKRRASIKDL